MFKNLQTVLFASFIGIVIISFLVFSFLATPRIKETTINQIGDDLYIQTALVESGFIKLLSARAGQRSIQSKAAEIAKLAKSRVTVINTNGKVLGDSLTPWQELSKLDNHLDRPEIKQALKKGQGRAVRYSETVGKDFIYTAVALKNTKGKIIGFLRLSVPTTLATTLVMKNQKSLIAALAVAILVAVLISMLFSRTFAHFRKLEEKHAQLEQHDKYRAEFVANVSHELKTPLTAIRNYVDTLMEGAVDDKKNNRSFLYKIDKHVVNLSSLIDDILEISRLEARKELGPLIKFDVSKVVRRAVDTIAEKARSKRITIETHCAENQYYINGLEDHVYRAVLNLLDNAVNYTSEDGKIDVFCQQKDGSLAITVADNGLGISKNHLFRIFERFYRVDQARSRELGGTGLGLAIVKHVMNIHNGSISVQSTVGEGSRFILKFPL